MHTIPLPKKNTSAEEHRFSRGEIFFAFAFLFTSSVLHTELKLSNSKKQLQRTYKTFPPGEPGTWSCLLSKWTKDAGSGWQGLLAWDCLSQWGTVVMKLALRAVPVCRLFVPQCCSFQGYNVVWNQTRLKGTAKGGVGPSLHQRLLGAPCKHPRGDFAFSAWDGMFQEALLQRNVRTLKCLLLIMGSGMIYLDTFDCTTA